MCKHLCVSWICELCPCCVASCFFFPPYKLTPSFLIQHINEGQICTKGRRVHGCVCSRAWLSAAFNSVAAGWGRGWQTAAAETFGWGAAIAPSYRFPHEGLPYHPGPERSPFFSHPRDTLLLSLPPHTLPSPPPHSPPFISTQCSVVQHSTERGGRASKIPSPSLSRAHINTHTHRNSHMHVYVRAYAQFAKTVFPV